MLSYKTAKNMVTRIMRDLGKNVLSTYCLDVGYGRLTNRTDEDLKLFNEFQKQIELLVSLLVTEGFSIVRKVAHTDHISKEDAEQCGFESLSYVSDEADSEDFRFDEPMKKAYCLRKKEVFVRVFIGACLNDFCLVECGGSKLLEFP